MGSTVKPYTIFEKSITRANDLLQLHKDGCDLEERDDLIRSAVIISVAAFDRYFTAKFCDVFIPFVKAKNKVNKATYSRLTEAGLDAKFALELVDASRPYRKIRTIIQNSLATHTVHRDHAIDALFLDLNLKELSKNAEKRAGRLNLRKRIEKLVEIRNDIAHSAHVRVNGDTKTIDRDEISKRIDEMELFVKNCDEIIDSKFGRKPAISA